MINQEKVRSPKKYRLVVRSAEEAVRLIREKLGDKAKVTSVRQVGGEGLKRFISSPKLEVIAEVEETNEKDSTQQLVQKQDDSPIIENETDENSTANEVEAYQANLNQETKLEQEGKDGSADIVSLLTRSGFDSSLLARLKSWVEWNEISQLPLADALKGITKGLADRLGQRPSSDLQNSVALLGSPGVGKTTTLCKLLAHEVFINKRVPNVLKLENDMPNPDDALRIFCEVIGVTLFREIDQCPVATVNSPLFIDVPGLSLSDVEEWEGTAKILDNKNVLSRILVLNGAYDSLILQKTLNLGSHANCTHLAITHFDELSNCTKLWPLLLDSSLLPFCICNGQNVTGDVSKGVLNQLIARTFPQELYNRGLYSYQRA